jgi:tRNA A-37 threonylcarbamoyl transferase component Bud32
MFKLENICKDYKIFVDTCAFMNKEAETFFNQITPKLKENKLLVHVSVLSQLKMLQKSNDDDTKNSAINGEKLFIKLYKKGKADKFKTAKNDIITDNNFVFIFNQYRVQYKLCLITLDNGLSTEIIKLNSSESSKFDKSGKKLIKGIKVLRYDYKGTPYEYTMPKPFFKKIKHIDLNKAKLLNTTIIPKEDDFVADENSNKYKLTKEIGKGAEAHIYLVNPRMVAKIYKKDKVTDLKIEKLKLMISNKMYIKPVCWPISLLFNSKNEPVGYLMKRVGDTANELHSIIGINKVHENFPKFKLVDLVKVALKILKVIEKLHNYNVIIGDLQPSNILITSNSFIFFVDSDSFQVESYPCPVGDTNFTPPNRQGLNYSSYLRTIEDENFAIATLLFNIFMLRLFPYSHIGGGDEQENIKKGLFPYLRDGKVTEKALPLGQKVWPHLPSYLQDAFINYFTKKSSLNISDWKLIMIEYQKDLTK